MRALLPIAALAALCGCVSSAPISQAPIDMNFANQSRETASTGIETSIIRARLRTNGQTAELANVPCRVTGPGYAASFTTPAALQLPLFGNTAPQLSLACTYQGETQTRSLNARNISEAQRREAREQLLEDIRENGEGLSAHIMVQLGSRRASGFDEFDYRNTSFTFRR